MMAHGAGWRKIKFALKIPGIPAESGLKRMLEDMDNGREIGITDVVACVHELDGTTQNPRKDKEIIAQIKEKVRYNEGNGQLKSSQCMAYLSSRIEIETEEELLNAFEVLDETKTGKIPLSGLQMLMEERGNPFNEEEMRLIDECLTDFHCPYDDGTKCHDGNVRNDVKKEKDTKPLMRRINREAKGNKSSKHSEKYKEIQIDYRGFVKALMGTINNQENKLWGSN